MNDITLVRSPVRGSIHPPARDTSFYARRPVIDVVYTRRSTITKPADSSKTEVVVEEVMTVTRQEPEYDHRSVIRPVEHLSAEDKVSALEIALAKARADLRRENYASKSKLNEHFITVVAVLILTAFVLGILGSIDLVSALSGR